MRIAWVIAAAVLVVGLGLGARYFLVGEDDPNNQVELPDGVEVNVEDTLNTVQDTVNDAMEDASTLPETVADTMADAGQQVEDVVADTLNNQLATLDESGELRFTLPLDCPVYGQDCYILKYVNAGLVTEPRDYACGSLTDPDHQGTDFRLIDYVEMERGVRVIAAAPGTVVEVKDGMPDANFRLFGRSAVTDRGLGNRVVINHGDGMVTVYGHMKRGSVVVAPGDSVARGQMLGLVGMSGLTEFPHVHFEVNERGSYIDPFTSGLQHEGCELDGETLWHSDVEQMLRYPRTLVMRQGFADEALNRAAVEYALFNQTISRNADALVFHVYLAGIQPGDAFIAEITGPNGERFVKSGSTFDSFQQSRLLAIGKQDLVEPLPAGTYTATFRYYRGGSNDVILPIESTVLVE